MEVLQTSALPLGYAATGRKFTPADSIRPDDRCQDTRALGGTEKAVERETGFEPATSTLARLHSTTELFPQHRNIYYRCGASVNPFARAAIAHQRVIWIGLRNGKTGQAGFTAECAENAETANGLHTVT